MARIYHALYLVIIATLLWMVVLRYQSQLPPQSRNLADTAQAFQADLIAKTENFQHVFWLGKPIWQSVLDLHTLQETIYEVKPDLLIECGTYKGGSAYYYAQLFDLMDHGRVITADIKKFHDLSHPRITFLIGDCASPEIVQKIEAEVKQVTGPVLVVLDSDHSAAHVTKEIQAYHRFVTPGSYLHVQDGVIDTQPGMTSLRPGPLRAIEAFLATNDDFELDTARSERFLITHHPKGWLKRKPTEKNDQ
jgi:cephalosporin hydroxylase